MFFGAGEKVVRKHGLEEGGEIGFAAEGPSTMGFAGPPLLVVVLLMEPKSRRFELLQLEFDSGRATVADVLSQIPVSANDERLKGQKYTGVASTDGKAKRPPIMLADFCSDNEVIVAVPSGMMATSVARLAQPILGNAQVMDLVSYSIFVFFGLALGEVRSFVLLSSLACCSRVGSPAPPSSCQMYLTRFPPLPSHSRRPPARTAQSQGDGQ